jgi:hypothetical protein
LGGSGMVVGSSGADLMLWFQLERGGDGTKRCWKIKRRQRAHLGLMGRKRDMMWRHDDIGQKRGGIGEGKGRRRRQLG